MQLRELSSGNTLDLVITFYNCENYLNSYLEELQTFCTWLTNNRKVNIKLILVEDGSSDESVDKLISWLKVNKMPGETRLLILSKNFGQHNAILAGLQESRSDYVLLMDGDLDQSPTFAKKLIKLKMDEGVDADVIYAYRKSNQQQFKDWTSKIFWKVLSKEFSQNLHLRQLSMRLMSRIYVDEILKYANAEKIFWGAIFHMSGFNQIGVAYEEKEQTETSYSTRKRLKLATGVFLNYTQMPYRYFVKFVLLLIGVTFTYIILQLNNLENIQENNPGWLSLFLILCTTLIVSVLSNLMLLYFLLESKRSNLKAPKYHIKKRIIV